MSAFALGAIDAQISDCQRSGHTGNVENLEEARAALAELINAAEQAHEYLCEKAPATATEFRLNKAIARIKGGAA